MAPAAAAAPPTVTDTSMEPAASAAPMPAAPEQLAAASPPASALEPVQVADAPGTAGLAADREPGPPPAPLGETPLPNLPPLAPGGNADDNPLPAIAADAADGTGGGDVATAESDAQSMEPARTELEKAEVRTGLSAEQMQHLREAQSRLSAGQATVALILLQALNAELESETLSYTVQPGDSLPSIASRREVYANAQLWPLVAHANLAPLLKAGRLHAGQVLVIDVHPTIEDVTNALEYARGHSPHTRPAPAAGGRKNK
jgi:nucleoid-associated protein YgaU